MFTRIMKMLLLKSVLVQIKLHTELLQHRQENILNDYLEKSQGYNEQNESLNWKFLFPGVIIHFMKHFLDNNVEVDVSNCTTLSWYARELLK